MQDGENTKFLGTLTSEPHGKRPLEMEYNEKSYRSTL
jgi:hypothetical protein